MAFCGNCGKQLPEGAKFCGNCGCLVVGAPIISQPVAPVYEAPVQYETPMHEPPERQVYAPNPELPVYAQPACAPDYSDAPQEEPKKKRPVWKILLPILGGILLLVIAAVLVLVFAKTHVDYIEVEADEIFLWTEDTCRVDYTAYPLDHDDEIYWYSSNETVAVVENGVIKAVGDGYCTITIQAGDDGAEAEITVEVATKICVDEFDVKYSKLLLRVGAERTVEWYAYPENYNEPVSWSSSDETIATVSENGEICGVSEGTCTVTIRSESGTIQNISVEVSRVRMEEQLVSGEWYSYNAYLNGEYLTYNNVWLCLEDADGTGYISIEDEEYDFTWAYFGFDYDCYYYEVVTADGAECMLMAYYDGSLAGEMHLFLDDEFCIFFEWMK